MWRGTSSTPGIRGSADVTLSQEQQLVDDDFGTVACSPLYALVEVNNLLLDAAAAESLGGALFEVAGFMRAANAGGSR